ncbi:hypothetical protein HDA32_000122 [Spinactinospora alkalitolerans]|uniref:Uncharacterized protein n=1 Tax=Spinactinospora alkalitolerans TaxID=687207 RepID=A0A852TQA0_9ACTN|nr:hypothetical protein [Spinactinospora alkalitolerans]NYE45002.1 hypothetical protein [Spinactinospora alkalitolerans]
MSDFTPFQCAACAAQALTEIAGGDPEEAVRGGYSPDDPRANTLVLCSALLDELTDAAHSAIAEDGRDAFHDAMSDRDQVIIVHADALRDGEYAAAVWMHIATRDAEGVAV